MTKLRATAMFLAGCVLGFSACAKTTQSSAASAFHAAFRKSFADGFMQSCTDAGKGRANVQSYCACTRDEMLKGFSDQALTALAIGDVSKNPAARQIALLCVRKTGLH